MNVFRIKLNETVKHISFWSIFLKLKFNFDRAKEILHIILIAILSFNGSSFANEAISQNQIEGELIIRMKSHFLSPGSKKFFGKIGQKGYSLKSSLGKMQMHLIKVPQGMNASLAMKELSDDPDVLYVEPNFKIKKVEVATDKINALSLEQMLSTVSSYSNGSYTQSRLKTGVDEAWLEMSLDSDETPVVAVIDTGVDYNHNILVQSNAVWNNSNEIPDNGIDDDQNGFIDDYNGWNFFSNNRRPLDDEGHGTHVSGIVIGVSFDIFQYPPLSSKVKIMPLKFLGADGSGDTASAIQAIDYAVNNGAKIINASWGGSSYSRALHDAFTRAYENGIFIVTAAGNSANDNDVSPIYPASLSIPGLITVAASNSYDLLAHFSNYGVQTVHLSAPGVSIASLYPNNLYGYSSGTSMAAPFVAGLGALLLRESPKLSGFQLKEIILNSVQTSTAYSQKIYTSGRVNVLAALRSAKDLSSAQTVIPSYTAAAPNRSVASEEASGSSDSGGKGVGGCGTIQAMRTFMKGKGVEGLSDRGGPDVLPIIILFMLPFVLWALLRSNSETHVEVARSEFDMRFSTRLSVSDSILVKTKEGQFTAELKNISKGGLAFTFSGKRVDVNDSVSFVFTSRDGKEKIEVSARIVWTDDKTIAGVQFHQLNSYIQGFFLRSYA